MKPCGIGTRGISFPERLLFLVLEECKKGSLGCKNCSKFLENSRRKVEFCARHPEYKYKAIEVSILHQKPSSSCSKTTRSNMASNINIQEEATTDNNHQGGCADRHKLLFPPLMLSLSR